MTIPGEAASLNQRLLMEVKRFRKLVRELKKKETLPYLVSDLTNIKYLTGFSGSHALLIVGEVKSYFMSDARYEEYARSILPRGVEFILQKEDINNHIKASLKQMGEKSLYLEEHSLMLSQYFDLKKKLRGIKVHPGGNEVNVLRMVKNDEEIDVIKRAAAVTDRCVKHLVSTVKPGMTEWDVAVEIEYFYRTNGCRKSSFDSIVASGPGSSMPHYETSMKKKIREGEVLLVDMGCTLDGYNSDLTRTFFVRSIDPLIEKIYHVVKEAQQRAVESVKPGITTGKLDSIARDIISEAGYGENFGHSLGHGLGLEVHEIPALRTGGDLRLKKNMVVTIEPGIYLPGQGGVRIEDMVLVTGKGPEILTKATKELQVI